MDNRQSAIKVAQKNQKLFLSGLDDLIRIPSISTDPERTQDVKKAAEYLATKLNKLGVEKVKVNPTKRHPIVTGEYMKAGADQPTILVYGHYDVQPVDPIDLWNRKPFDPTTDGDYHFGRGA